MATGSSTGNHLYDVVITGGHLIDPANGVSRVSDVAIRDGVIAAIQGTIPAEQGQKRIDASGQYVTPGLIDLHTHIYWGVTYWGIDADPVAARTGVTTWLDVGSSGGYTFPGFREYIVERNRTRIYALLNLSSIGLVAPTWELANPDYLDVDLAAGIIERNRDIILGIKARIDRNTTRGTGPADAEGAGAGRQGGPAADDPHRWVASGAQRGGRVPPSWRYPDALLHRTGYADYRSGRNDQPADQGIEGAGPGAGRRARHRLVQLRGRRGDAGSGHPAGRHFQRYPPDGDTGSDVRPANDVEQVPEPGDGDRGRDRLRHNQRREGGPPGKCRKDRGR